MCACRYNGWFFLIQQLLAHYTNHKHRQVSGQNEKGTTPIQLDSGNEAGHKSAQAGMRSSLPLQVSRCQGEFIHIIHSLNGGFSHEL
jgi:hypothetical protein